MAKYKKPREWWISRAEDFGPGSGDYIYKQKPSGTHSSKAIHVIEKSVYHKVMEAFKDIIEDLEDIENYNDPTVMGKQRLKKSKRILKELGE